MLTRAGDFKSRQPSMRPIGVAPIAYAGERLHYGSMKEESTLDPVFKALADPTRRLLLDRLRHQNGQTLTELCRSLEMARQSATQPGRAGCGA